MIPGAIIFQPWPREAARDLRPGADQRRHPGGDEPPGPEADRGRGLRPPAQAHQGHRETRLWKW